MKTATHLKAFIKLSFFSFIHYVCTLYNVEYDFSSRIIDRMWDLWVGGAFFVAC